MDEKIINQIVSNAASYVEKNAVTVHDMVLAVVTSTSDDPERMAELAHVRLYAEYVTGCDYTAELDGGAELWLFTIDPDTYAEQSAYDDAQRAELVERDGTIPLAIIATAGWHWIRRVPCSFRPIGVRATHITTYELVDGEYTSVTRPID